MSGESKTAKRPRADAEHANGAVKKKKLSDVLDLSSLDDQSRRIIEAKLLVRKRDKARLENDFEKSDQLRARLSDLGVEVIDQKGGPSVSCSLLGRSGWK